MCRGNPDAIEKMLYLGRELQQMSQTLKRELGKNKQNKTMLHVRIRGMFFATCKL